MLIQFYVNFKVYTKYNNVYQSFYSLRFTSFEISIFFKKGS